MADPVERKSRRGFINLLLSTSLGATLISIFYPVIKFMIPPKVAESPKTSVVAATRTELPANSAKVFKFGNKPGILINTPDGGLKAFSATCTHLDCTVQYRPDWQNIWCACHNGRYDLNGHNIAGPPPRPLEPFDVNVRGDEIIVSKKGV